MSIDFVTVKDMRKVDYVAVNDYGLKIKQMMENAGRNLSEFVKDLKPKKVSILYGRGNNGGGGLVCARHLMIKGIGVEIIPASEKTNEIVRDQLRILKKSKVNEVDEVEEIGGDTDVIVDALLGYNINGNPKGRYAELIDYANQKEGVRIVSLDVPSGINPDTGEEFDPCIKADYILTLALPKAGLKNISHGDLYLVNIGIPNKVYEDIGIKPSENYFNRSDIVKI